ncbi:MAG: hydrolase [Thermoplasmata archaeon]|nr:hydrolase [Thermoplasmata archaeon]
MRSFSRDGSEIVTKRTGIDRKKLALVIIDIQDKLYPSIQDKESVKENVIKLIEFSKIMGIPIIFSEQYPRGLGETIQDIKDVLPDYGPLEKNTFSCCGEGDFEARLLELGVETIAITGIECHVCVFQTTRDTLARGYNVHVISDGVASRTPENKKVGLDRAREMGAVISSTEMFMFEVMERAGTSEFKEVAPLLK